MYRQLFVRANYFMKPLWNVCPIWGSSYPCVRSEHLQHLKVTLTVNAVLLCRSCSNCTESLQGSHQSNMKSVAKQHLIGTLTHHQQLTPVRMKRKASSQRLNPCVSIPSIFFVCLVSVLVINYLTLSCGKEKLRRAPTVTAWKLAFYQ